MDIHDLACYILREHAPRVGGITPLKLQKLLYYVKVWGLVAGKPLLEADFQAWEHGPVNPDIYCVYKEFQDKPITPPCDHTPFPPAGEKEMIDFIVENYIDFHAYALSSMTHSEEPWKETPRNGVIPDNGIRKYYRKLPFAKNFPLSEQKPFYPVLSDMEHAYTFDMSPGDATLSTKFDTYAEYKAMKAAARRSVDRLKRTWSRKLG